MLFSLTAYDTFGVELKKKKSGINIGNIFIVSVVAVPVGSFHEVDV